MKLKLLFTLLIITSQALVSFAQIGLDTDSLYTQVIESNDITAHNTFTNDIPQQKTFKWTRTIIENTDPWTYAVCDDNQCYLTHVESAEIDIPPSGSSILDVHLYPNGKYEGYAFVEVKVEYSNDPNTNIFAYYVFDSALTTSTKNVKPINFKIFPNPSHGLFTIEDDSKEVVSIKVFSMIGQELQHLIMGERQWMDLSTLSNGNYFIQLLDDKGNSLGVKQVSKL